MVTVWEEDSITMASSTTPFELNSFLGVSSKYIIRVMLSLTQNEVNTRRELIIFQQDPNRINVRFRNNHHVNTILWINTPYFDDKEIFIFGNYSTFNNHPSPSLFGPSILYVGNSIRMGDLHIVCFLPTSNHSDNNCGCLTVGRALNI